MSSKEIIELPPSCTWCEEFLYNKEQEEIYGCKTNCMRSNDIFELFEECPYLHLKYAVKEIKEGEEDGAD